MDNIFFSLKISYARHTGKTMIANNYANGMMVRGPVLRNDFTSEFLYTFMLVDARLLVEVPD